MLDVVSLCAAMPRRMEDLQALLNRGRSETYRHVARGVDLGLLDRVALLRFVPTLVVATSEGHRFCGSGLREAGVSPGGFIHALSCSAVAARLVHAYPDAAILSEAELRRDEKTAGRLIASVEVNESGRHRRHCPDLVPMRPGLRPAPIEIELTPKAPARLLEIIRAWRRASYIEPVGYFAGRVGGCLVSRPDRQRNLA